MRWRFGRPGRAVAGHVISGGFTRSSECRQPKLFTARCSAALAKIGSAEAAGLVLQSSQPRGSDVVAIAIATARGPATLAWLDALAAQGIGVESLTVTPAADGTVSVNATLRRAGS